MILVILLHSVSYYRSTGGDVPEWATQFVNALAPIRMPTLFFLSGMMINFGLKKGVRAFLIRRASILIWPYLLWCVIWAFASGNAPGLMSVDGWLGGWYLWFLLFIIAYSLAAAIIPARHHAVGAVYFYVISLLMEDGTKYGERLFLFMAIFFLGSVVGRDVARLERHLADRKALALVPIAGGILLYSAFSGPVRYSPHDAGIIAIVAFMALAFCRWLASRYSLRMLAALGRNSITVYLVHMPMIAVVVALFRAGGVNSFIPVFATSLGMAICVSVLAVTLRSRFAPVDWLFTFPFRAHGPASPKPDATMPSRAI